MVLRIRLLALVAAVVIAAILVGTGYLLATAGGASPVLAGYFGALALAGVMAIAFLPRVTVVLEHEYLIRSPAAWVFGEFLKLENLARWHPLHRVEHVDGTPGSPGWRYRSRSTWGWLAAQIVRVEPPRVTVTRARSLSMPSLETTRTFEAMPEGTLVRVRNVFRWPLVTGLAWRARREAIAAALRRGGEAIAADLESRTP